MRIIIDKEYIKSINSSNNEYICPVELEMDRKHLCNMLKNDVKCCVLVTGYRGVGKSSFIKSVLEELRDETKILIVKMNLASYENYSVFLKRLIRAIYFTCLEYKEKLQEDGMEAVFERIELLYIHTFYNILDYYKEEENDEYGYSVQTEVKAKSAVKDLIKKWVEVLPDIAAVFGVWYATQHWIVKVILSIVYLISKLISVSVKIKSWKKGRNDKKYGKEIESLYDDEIAEYQLFETIKQIEDNDTNRLLFVFDEVDKIEETDKLKQVIGDIKPLLLSNHSSFIFIAGREMKSFVSNQLEQEDSVVSSLFSKEVYISLSTIDEMINMWGNFVVEDEKRNRKLEKRYLFEKVLSSKGVMRKFINQVIADVNWEDNGEAYIEIDECEWPSDIVIDTIKDFTESYESTFDEKTRDDNLYQLYGWADVVLKKDFIDLKELVPDETKEELLELCKEFFDELESKGVLEEVKDKLQYVRKKPKTSNIVEMFIAKDEETMKNIQSIYERMAYIILSFGRVYGCANVSDINQKANKQQFYNEVIKTLEYMKVRNDSYYLNRRNAYPYDVIMNFLEMYEQISTSERVEVTIEELMRIAEKAERQVGGLVETLFRAVLNRRLDPYFEVTMDNSIEIEGTGRYDIAIRNRHTKKVEIAIECKVYRHVMKGVVESLRRTAYDIAVLREDIKPKRLFFVIFIDKEDYQRTANVREKGRSILLEAGVRGDIYIIDWNNFDVEMNRLIEKDILLEI